MIRYDVEYRTLAAARARDLLPEGASCQYQRAWLATAYGSTLMLRVSWLCLVASVAAECEHALDWLAGVAFRVRRAAEEASVR